MTAIQSFRNVDASIAQNGPKLRWNLQITPTMKESHVSIPADAGFLQVRFDSSTKSFGWLYHPSFEAFVPVPLRVKVMGLVLWPDEDGNLLVPTVTGPNTGSRHPRRLKLGVNIPSNSTCLFPEKDSNHWKWDQTFGQWIIWVDDEQRWVTRDGTRIITTYVPDF